MTATEIRSTACRGRPTGGERGFTLIELLTVVVIVGILATIGLVGYRRFIQSSKTSEAIYMVGSIRAAEENYRAETLTYLDVSKSFAKLYPMETPAKKKWAWDNPAHDDYDNWRKLGARSDGPVMYGYKVQAGLAGQTPKALDITKSPTWPTTTEPWYIIEGAGDVDADGTFCYVTGSSFTGELYIENEGD